MSASCVQVADRAGELLGMIVPNIQKTAELVREIAAASKEQNTGTEQINRALQQLDQVIQQNATASEEMASTSEELASQSDQLQSTIDFFNIGENELGAVKKATLSYKERDEDRVQSSETDQAGFPIAMGRAESEIDNRDMEFERY